LIDLIKPLYTRRTCISCYMGSLRCVRRRQTMFRKTQTVLNSPFCTMRKLLNFFIELSTHCIENI